MSIWNLRRNWLDRVPLLLLGSTLFLANPAQSQTDELVFRGIPEHKIESYEDEDVRYELNSDEASDAEVIIVATEDSCVWQSRGDRPVAATISGGFLIFETRTPSASYLKVVRGMDGQYTAPSEIGHVFLEHVSEGLATISYRGRSVEVHRPERCLSRGSSLPESH
jgi:hypothetical protein